MKKKKKKKKKGVKAGEIMTATAAILYQYPLVVVWASEASICSHDHGDSTPVSHVRQGLVEERKFLKFGESERERERERDVKWEKVEKKNNETRIDDVAILYNRWIKSMVDIRTIAPRAIP